MNIYIKTKHFYQWLRDCALKFEANSPSELTFEICEEWDKTCCLRADKIQLIFEKKDWRILIEQYLEAEGISSFHIFDIISLPPESEFNIKLITRFRVQDICPRIKFES